MPICPRCHDTYRDGVATCVDCGVELLPDDAVLPARVDRLLGTFDPVIAERLAGLLSHRGVPHRLMDVPGGTEVVVDRTAADDLRAELLVSWDAVLAGMDPEDRALLAGTRLRGWLDPPSAPWVDRDGNVRVAADDTHESTNDAARMWGPSLLVVGSLLALYGWYSGSSPGMIVFGILAIVIGLFLPR
jgi:hypothetical protein